MAENEIHVKYYGLEKLVGTDWIQCGIIGATDDIPYTDIRQAIDMLEGYRVRPIEDRALWQETLKTGRIIEFKTFCTALLILSCTK